MRPHCTVKETSQKFDSAALLSRQRQVRHNESNAREQFVGMMLDLRRHPTPQFRTKRLRRHLLPIASAATVEVGASKRPPLYIESEVPCQVFSRRLSSRGRRRPPESAFGHIGVPHPCPSFGQGWEFLAFGGVPRAASVRAGPSFSTALCSPQKNAQNAQRGRNKSEIMEHAAAEALASLCTCCEKSLRLPIACNQRLGTRGPFSAPATNQGGPRGTPFVSEVFVTDHGSQVAGHRSLYKSLQCAVAQKCVCNSFGMCTCKSLDLKSPEMNTYKKYRGGGGLRSLQTHDLSRIFHTEAPIKASSSAQVPLPSTASAYLVPGLEATTPRLAHSGIPRPRNGTYSQRSAPYDSSASPVSTDSFARELGKLGGSASKPAPPESRPMKLFL